MEAVINSAIDLMNSKKFDEAQKVLLSLRQIKPAESLVNFYLGVLYLKEENPNKSSILAKSYFQDASSSEYVVIGAFIELAKLEKNQSQRLIVINNGLSIFPDSIELYELLLDSTEEEKRDEIFKDLKSKSLFSDSIFFTMFWTYNKLQRYSDMIEMIDKVGKKDIELSTRLLAIKAFCLIEVQEISLSKGIFKNLIEEDLKNNLNCAPFFGFIICSILEGNMESAVWAFNHIPEDYEINTQIYAYPLIDCFEFDKYFKNVLEILEGFYSKDKKALAKIRGMRGFFEYANQSDNVKVAVIKDLEYADRHIPNNKNYSKHLCYIYTTKEKYMDAYKYCLKTISNHSQEENRWLINSNYFYNFLKNSDSDTLMQIYNDFYEFIRKQADYVLEKYSQTILKPLIQRLFNEKYYSQVVKLSELFKESLLEKSDILFQMAFSYNEIKNRELSKKYYQVYERKHGVTSATSNNLGVLYEKSDDLTASQALFQKAIELDSESQMAKDNYKRVSDQIVKRENDKIESEKAAKDFEKEDAWFKSKMISFLKYKNGNSLIVCSYKQLPQYFGVSETVATSVLKTMLDKKYIYKVTNHNLDTRSSVYKLNDDIEKIIRELEIFDNKERELIDLVRNINLETVQKLGYDDRLLDCLKKISSSELQVMLQRDLKENILALVTSSFKTSLIMSGSIIEAVLLDKIHSKQITSYTLELGKKLRINQMDLNELLYVANKERMIDTQLFHLAHALRTFRNLIHPGVEQRKSAIVITEDNALLAWNITRKIIMEI